MLAEITFGYRLGSMALVADGWHMATHVGALSLAALAESFARRYAGHRSLAFGTGKVSALAGYTSAVALGFAAVSMLAQSATRLLRPEHIHYQGALVVAIVGLMVNLASVVLLHDRQEDLPDLGASDAHEGDDRHGHGQHYHEARHDHTHHHEVSQTQGHHHHKAPHGHHRHHELHDHNHRAALLHVVADALTSVLAIFALSFGAWLNIPTLDPVVGMLGGLVILHWGFGLVREAGRELLDAVPSPALESQIEHALGEIGDARVSDLHLWSLGKGRLACVATVVTSTPEDPSTYHAALAPFRLTHLTVEVQRCTEGHERLDLPIGS
jgi:cation diffusion facilitator family transporter